MTTEIHSSMFETLLADESINSLQTRINLKREIDSIIKNQVGGSFIIVAFDYRKKHITSLELSALVTIFQEYDLQLHPLCFMLATSQSKMFEDYALEQPLNLHTYVSKKYTVKKA